MTKTNKTKNMENRYDDWKMLKLGLIETWRMALSGAGDVRKGAVAIGEDGRVDSPALREIMGEADELKAWSFLECAERTKPARKRIPADGAALEKLADKAQALEGELSGIEVPVYDPKGNQTAAEKKEIRRLGRERATKRDELSSAKAEAERVREDMEEALKEIRQIEEETVLSVCEVEAIAHRKMNAYIKAASRKAGEAFEILAPQESLFSTVAEELYAFLNRDEDLPARGLYIA